MKITQAIYSFYYPKKVNDDLNEPSKLPNRASHDWGSGPIQPDDKAALQ